MKMSILQKEMDAYDRGRADFENFEERDITMKGSKQNKMEDF